MCGPASISPFRLPQPDDAPPSQVPGSRTRCDLGRLCSVCVLPQSFTDAQFEAHLDEALAAAGDGRGIILSLADTTPPDASLERIRHIGERVYEYGV